MKVPGFWLGQVEKLSRQEGVASLVRHLIQHTSLVNTSVHTRYLCTYMSGLCMGVVGLDVINEGHRLPLLAGLRLCC
jgi:hypothetical protein